MSVTFSVFPLQGEIPTFREVLHLATEKLNRFLRTQNIDFNAKVEIRLLTREANIEQKIDLDSLAKWEGDFYAWFTISSINGGIDSYYWELNEEDKADNLEELLDKDLGKDRRTLIENCLENKVEWNFRKSAGQLCITGIAFGFIVSAFAELTDGIIFSGDGAWEYQIFPATAEEFDECYFRPEKILSDNSLRRGVQSCLEATRFELQNNSIKG